MQPAILPISFELGANGVADYLVTGLAMTAAEATFRAKGSATILLSLPCPVVGSTVQMRLTPAQTAILGSGIHSYQLDVVSGGQSLRIAKGSVTVAFGIETVF